MIRLENQASNYTWNRCNLHADLDKSDRNEERKGGYIGAWKIVQPCDSDGKKFYDRFLLFICLINSIKRKKKGKTFEYNFFVEHRISRISISIRRKFLYDTNRNNGVAITLKEENE